MACEDDTTKNYHPDSGVCPPEGCAHARRAEQAEQAMVVDRELLRQHLRRCKAHTSCNEVEATARAEQAEAEMARVQYALGKTLERAEQFEAALRLIVRAQTGRELDTSGFMRKVAFDALAPTTPGESDLPKPRPEDKFIVNREGA